MSGLQQINWQQIRTYFITQTSNTEDRELSISAMAKRFGVSNVALAKMANKFDDTNRTWWDYRDEFVSKKVIDDGAEKIKGLVDNTKKTAGALKAYKNVILGELMKTFKDERSRKKFFDKMRPKDILELLKLESELNDKLIGYTRRGLDSDNAKIILKINKPLDEMNLAELDEFSKKLENFDFEEAEYEVLNEQ